VIGHAALRLNRWRSQILRKDKSKWKSDNLHPPLKISARTKELAGRHYLQGRHVNRTGKVAWVTSGAPVEFLKALGFYLYYPENHGAVCGTLRKAEEIVVEAEKAGYSSDICSYARTDIGSMLSGKTPVGRIPGPGVVAHHFKVPLIVIDTPFIYSELHDHSISFVQKQLEEAIPVAEKVAGRQLDMSRLTGIIRLSRTATQLWMEVLQRCRYRPSPISVFDQFTQMAPIVEMRGDSATVDLYAKMLREVDDRVAQGIGAVRNESTRLLWDNLPIWPRMRYLAEYLGEHGIVVNASTYTNAWGELADLMDADRPLESIARTYLHPILNRGTGHKLATMEEMIDFYGIDGAILHSDRSCKPYSVGQMDQRKRLASECGIPAMLLEADHSDPRAFAEDQVANNLSAFIEMLDTKRTA
jgi:benzoyl-CoA reductase/2-hydroxyglutaryl-CoA dehydratase subunit BcrC/BadD/HgdB